MRTAKLHVMKGGFMACVARSVTPRRGSRGVGSVLSLIKCPSRIRHFLVC
jgi:hypothetical protein